MSVPFRIHVASEHQNVEPGRGKLWSVLAIVTFSDQASVLCGLTPVDAAGVAAGVLQRAPAGLRRVIAVLSDGRPTSVSRLDAPVPGAITVVYKTPKTSVDRKTTASGYHVAFYVSGTNASLTLFGGNQRNQVNEKSFAGWEVQGYRWPL